MLGCWTKEEVDDAGSSSTGDSCSGDSGRKGRVLEVSPSSGFVSMVSKSPFRDGKLRLRICKDKGMVTSAMAAKSSVSEDGGVLGLGKRWTGYVRL
jgi:hypothetical protein